MASSLDISKIKLKENGNSYYSTFQIKDNVSRTQKMDKINPNGSGYFKLNAGDKAPGANSISLGYRNNATGNCAAAIGSQNLAAGDFSFAAGIGTKTISAYQFVLGEYNEPLDLDILEIGNGSNDTARSNLLRITKDGNFYIAGDILYGGTKDTQSPISLTSKLEDIESKIVQNEYTLPMATRSSLGGVKIGSNIDLDKDGTISVTFPDSSLYELPPADKETLGGVIIGDNIEVDKNGKISVIFPNIPEEYILPTASATTLGGIKVAVAAGFRVDSDGVLNFAVNKMDQNNPQGSGYIKMNTSGNAGLYSVSLGNNNKAEGENSIALGKNNTSSKSNSISLGTENTSGGENSIIIGSQSEINANNSFSIGINSTISGTESFTIGKDLESNYDGQFVIGKYNENKEENYFELGIGSISNRKNALAITTEGKAYFLNDILVKNADDTYTNIAAAARDYINNPYKLPVASSTTLGGIKVGNNLEIDEDGVLSATIKPVLDNIECTGYFSHNRVNTTTIGKNSFASNSSALAYKSTAFGENTIAGVEKTATREVYNEETQSYETEEYTFIDGRASFAEGCNTVAGGIYSHAAGNNTIANDAYQFAIGSYNNNSEQNLFEIGNGADDNNRSNAFAVDRIGNAYIKSDLYINEKSIYSPASADSFGMIKVGNNLEITEEGILNALAEGSNEELTEDEYLLLSEEEKLKNTVYFITDKNKIYYKNVEYGSGNGSTSNIKCISKQDYDALEKKEEDILYIVIEYSSEKQYLVKDGEIFYDGQKVLNSGTGTFLIEEVDNKKYLTMEWSSSFSNNGMSIEWDSSLLNIYDGSFFHVELSPQSTFNTSLMWMGPNGFWTVINNSTTDVKKNFSSGTYSYDLNLSDMPDESVKKLGIGTNNNCKLWIDNIYVGINNKPSKISYYLNNVLIGDGGGGSVVVDTELDENSNNPIANSTVAKLFKNSFYNSKDSTTISDVNIISSSSSNNYSTEEHKVGTWIDGSDIYEKTYCPVTSGILEEDFSNKEIIESHGYMNYANNNKISVGNPWGCIYKSSANKLIIEPYNASFDFTYQYNHVTVRYIYRKE